jgi:hypothetical protein
MTKRIFLRIIYYLCLVRHVGDEQLIISTERLLHRDIFCSTLIMRRFTPPLLLLDALAGYNNADDTLSGESALIFSASLPNDNTRTAFVNGIVSTLFGSAGNSIQHYNFFHFHVSTSPYKRFRGRNLVSGCWSRPSLQVTNLSCRGYGATESVAMGGTFYF